MGKFTNKIIDLFFKNHSLEATKGEFFSWLLGKNQEEEKKRTLLEIWNEPSDVSEIEAYKAYNRFSSIQIKSKRRKQLVWLSSAAAVVLIVGFSSLLFLKNTPPNYDLNYVEYYSPSQGTRNLILPDGSEVDLNSESILFYSKDFGEENRVLYLSGEANFKVAKNEKKPFIVQSKEFSITALGTEFSVASYPNDNIFKTTLISGSIKVEGHHIQSPQILKVGEQFSYNKLNENYDIQAVDIYNEIAWQRGVLVFKSATIEEILKVLERKYDVTFHYNIAELHNDKYNFKFKKDTSIESVLTVISNVADGFEYKIADNGTIYIK